MADPIEYKQIAFGVLGTYAAGCVPEFDPETRVLVVGPGILRAPQDPDEGDGLEEEFIFPGGRVALPPGTTEVLIAWRRSNRASVLIVNVGMGVDDVTYCPIYTVYQYGSCWDEKEKVAYMAHILRHFRLSKKEIRQWAHTQYKVPPTDMGQFRGIDAYVHVQSEYPEALRLTVGREYTAQEARKALKNLLRVPATEWTDQDMRQVLLNIVLSDSELEVPEELLRPLP